MKAIVLRHLRVALALALLLPLMLRAQSTPKIHALIVTGIDYPGHHWWETTPVLKESLSALPNLQVSVLDDPYKLGETDLAPYQVLILHFMNWEKPAPGETARQNLTRFVQQGGGLVGLHFACGAFSNWTEYPNLLGRIWDGVNTHDPRGPFTVHISPSDHPVTAGLAPSFETDDELYIGLTGDKPVTILATARSKITQTDHPMALVHTYGKGRVFFTPLGHDVKALKAPGASQLIRQAVLWVARQPTPSATRD